MIGREVPFGLGEVAVPEHAQGAVDGDGRIPGAVGDVLRRLARGSAKQAAAQLAGEKGDRAEDIAFAGPGTACDQAEAGVEGENRDQTLLLIEHRASVECCNQTRRSVRVVKRVIDEVRQRLLGKMVLAEIDALVLHYDLAARRRQLQQGLGVLTVHTAAAAELEHQLTEGQIGVPGQRCFGQNIDDWAARFHRIVSQKRHENTCLSFVRPRGP